MNNAQKRPRPLLLFYILFIYVLLQFGWWSYLMVELNNEIYHLKSDLNIKNAKNPEEASRTGNELEEKLHLRWAMTAGEGSVFLVLLVLGVMQTRNAFRKETALTRQQKNFLLSVTHELKSPIASVKLQLETIQKRELDKEKQKEILQNALTDTERLNKLVENILLATRIDNSAFTLHRVETNISELVDEIIKQARASIKQKVECDIEPGIILLADGTTFPSIILNLLENASKYSPPGSTIKVKLKKNRNTVSLSVANEGQGISEEDKQNIFQKFYRAGNEETRKTKGTGLGLYIVKYLVEQHNGTISVKNNSPSGSIFEVNFTPGLQ
ncbi:MAG TPA: ATP-binding protein [Bacteroidia bacterium]|jgi:K+-sensing histidine kinase KdpD